MSQQRLAAVSGVTQATISALETGEHATPNLRTLTQLEEALHVTPGALLKADQGTISASIDRFIASDLGKSLRLTPEEIADLRNREWYTVNEDPDPVAWYEFANTLRRMRERSGN